MKLIALILLALSLPAHAVKEDKILHFGGSALFGLAASSLTEDSEHPVLYATTLALLPGLLKELSDNRMEGNRFSGADMAANLAGALTGVAVGNISHDTIGKDWTAADTKRQIVYTAIVFADWMQTRYMIRYPERWSEANPLLGNHPSASDVNRHALIGSIVIAGIAYAYPPKQRRWFQYGMIGVHAGVIGRNYTLGVKMELP